MQQTTTLRPAHIIQSERGWLIHTPAKLNLFFELLRKREDGYHEIESLMVPISLYDTLIIEIDRASSEPLQLECRALLANQRPDEFIPADQRNLVWRAVTAIRQLRDLPAGMRLTLFKRIPSQAGLGGGSSDAAATLLLLNEALKLRLNAAELQELASKLGSDVPFFLTPCPQIARGRGEILVPQTGLSRLHCVVIAPPQGLSTPAVYGRSVVPAQPRHLEPLVTALKSASSSLHGLLWNSLEAAAMELSSEISKLATSVSQTNCLGQLMSGSGSSYFGLYANARAAAMAARQLRAKKLGQVFQVSSLS
jgi:4-diphosphocytidyl-2-C-methyl-D-erythritol kinase